MFDKKGIQKVIRQINKKRHNSNKSMQNKKLILIAASGAFGGALLGLLFAPEKGKKTRKNLTSKRDKYLKEIKETTEELSKQLKKNTDSILENSRDTVQNLTQDIKDYSKLTSQELYDKAKELKVEGYSKMKKSELIQALKDS